MASQGEEEDAELQWDPLFPMRTTHALDFFSQPAATFGAGPSATGEFEAIPGRGSNRFEGLDLNSYATEANSSMSFILLTS
ncbi:hypothetical protein PR202_gb00622 [Eleusine coracana subsp. coracana]|uniref:Uncharacterized protein n=1 Tax=Eleusine coracana subsp. coracana TaxID=191504 RepID=A0AAV5DUJ6_ELECO|nr:hypothetical protein PR202_gb00622 [Eleusine coracana subsp. coracana]